LRRFALLPTGGLAAEAPFYTCLECGLLWSKVSAPSVKKFVTKYGTKKTKETYGLQDDA
jgi:hypothetical protein